MKFFVGMIILTWTVVAGALFLPLFLFVSILPETPCEGAIARLEVNAGIAPRGVNIRNLPAGTIKESLGFKIGQIRFATRSVPVGGDVWWELCEGGWVAQSVLIVTKLHLTPTIVQTATPLRTPDFTPTWIQTNTPLPPLIRTQTAGQYAYRFCWVPPDAPQESPGVCTLYPFGSRFTLEMIQIQP